MAAAIRCPESGRTQKCTQIDAPSPFSLLATEQPQINLLAAWTLDEDAPFGEQPRAKRVQVVLCSVYNFEVRFTKKTKPANDIVAMITRLALKSGYAAISQITSASYEQSRGGHGNQSGRRNSGGAGQSALGSTVSLGAGNGGSGPSKHPMKRGGNGDGEGGPNKRRKPSNDSQRAGELCCIIFELNQQSPEADENHPCRDKRFATLDGAVNHHLRIHVGHIQCETCFIRKGTITDMNKHKLAAGCTPPPAEIREEIKIHGRNIHDVKSWDELKRQVAPNGEIQYDMVNNVDNLARPPPGQDQNHVEQPLAPYQINPQDILALGDDFTKSTLVGHTMKQALDQFGYSPWTTDTINPLFINNTPLDSGYIPSTNSDVGVCHDLLGELQNQTSTGGGGARQVTSGNTEVHLRQFSEVRNQTSTGGGAGRVTSGNEALEQCLSLELLKSLNSVLEAFREWNKYPEAARECARNIALQAPENVLQVFADAYQYKVLSEKETQACNSYRRAKGKEEERYRSAADGA